MKFIKAGVRNPILKLLALRHIRRVDIELGGVADRQSLQPIKLRYFGLFNGKNVMFDQVFSVSNIAPHCDLHLVLALIKDKKRSFRFLLARLQLDHIGNRVVCDHAYDVYQFVGRLILDFIDCSELQIDGFYLLVICGLLNFGANIKCYLVVGFIVC